MQSPGEQAAQVAFEAALNQFLTIGTIETALLMAVNMEIVADWVPMAKAQIEFILEELQQCKLVFEALCMSQQGTYDVRAHWSGERLLVEAIRGLDGLTVFLIDALEVSLTVKRLIFHDGQVD
jgi:hypothetical protein